MSKEELENHLRMNTDRGRADPLIHTVGIPCLMEPGKLFNLNLPTWLEIQEVVKMAHSGSALWDKKYKKCPEVLRVL